MMDRQTDARTDDGQTDAWGKIICLPTPKGEDIITMQGFTFAGITDAEKTKLRPKN